MSYGKLVCIGITAVTLAGRLVHGQSGTAAREIQPLQLEEQIPVPHVAGRLDHFTADVKRKRLFVSALGNNTVEVIDIFQGEVIHSIPGLARLRDRYTYPASTNFMSPMLKTARCGYLTEQPTH